MGYKSNQAKVCRLALKTFQLLNQLLKLYKKHRTNTPLEDFTTEALVGVLNIEQEVKQAFIEDFLHLKIQDYHIKSQVKYSLKDDTDCIVDLVIEGENNICFIENKVNSNEGYRQIERYGKVLDNYSKNGFQTSLIYCTKYPEKKEYGLHNFKQIHWHQIAKFLKKYNSNNLVQEFIIFLTTNDMALDTTMNTKNYLTIENIQNTLNILNSYLEKEKPVFEETFITETKVSDGRTMSQILNHNRLIYYYKDIIANGGWSEIKYGILLNEPSIYVGIYVDKSNYDFDNLREALNETKVPFEIHEYNKGISFLLKKSISRYLNDENGELEISEWYKNAFMRFASFIREKNYLDWNIQVE